MCEVSHRLFVNHKQVLNFKKIHVNIFLNVKNFCLTNCICTLNMKLSYVWTSLSVQIYAESKLLFCDHILNGYGYTRSDFNKQIYQSKHDSLHRKFLPPDFRFRYV